MAIPEARKGRACQADGSQNHIHDNFRQDPPRVVSRDFNALRLILKAFGELAFSAAPYPFVSQESPRARPLKSFAPNFLAHNSSLAQIPFFRNISSPTVILPRSRAIGPRLPCNRTAFTKPVRGITSARPASAGGRVGETWRRRRKGNGSRLSGSPGRRTSGRAFSTSACSA